MKNFILKDDKQERTVVIEYPDKEDYHQPGWDICVRDSANNEISEFIEIKTHTKNSVLRNQIKLSNEQMKKAIREKEHYHVLVAIYDYSQRVGVEIGAYKEFLKNIEKGTVTNSQNGYVFIVSSSAEVSL